MKKTMKGDGMYKVKIAYRFQNNQVQGFVGKAFQKSIAKQMAFEMLYDKLEFIDELFDKRRLVYSLRNLTEEELWNVHNDWNERLQKAN